MRKPTPETMVQHWNTAYTPGVEVDLREDDGSITRTKTRGPAWLLGGHTPVVQVDGKAGCYALSRIKAIVGATT